MNVINSDKEVYNEFEVNEIKQVLKITGRCES